MLLPSEYVPALQAAQLGPPWPARHCVGLPVVLSHACTAVDVHTAHDVAAPAAFHWPTGHSAHASGVVAASRNLPAAQLVQSPVVEHVTQPIAPHGEQAPTLLPSENSPASQAAQLGPP